MPKLGMRTSGESISKSKKLVKLIVQFAVLAIIIGGLFFLVHRHNVNKSNSTVVKPRTINQFESDLSKSTNGFLASSDYTSYQASQSVFVTQYLLEKDVADAQRVMDNVLAKVPANKLDSQTYTALVKIDEAKKDTAKLKSDLKILVEKQKAEGNTAGADASQKYLDSLK